MSLGPGKYDDLCTHVREQTQAEGVILIVLDGNKGSSFCAQASLDAQLRIPDMLEKMAAKIRADHQNGNL